MSSLAFDFPCNFHVNVQQPPQSHIEPRELFPEEIEVPLPTSIIVDMVTAPPMPPSRRIAEVLPRSFQKQTIASLRKLCKARNLSAEGSKADLVSRLEHDEQDSEPSTPPVSQPSG